MQYTFSYFNMRNIIVSEQQQKRYVSRRFNQRAWKVNLQKFRVDKELYYSDLCLKVWKKRGEGQTGLWLGESFCLQHPFPE